MKRTFCKVAVSGFAVVCMAGAGWSAPALQARFNQRNGGVDSLSIVGDPAGMNWVEGTGTWGTLLAHSMRPSWAKGTDCAFRPPFFDCLGVTSTPNGVTAHYALDNLRADVTRVLSNGELVETYDIRNAGTTPHYFLRGHLGIMATFNDNYVLADECQVRRCDAHIFTGGEVSWVHAVKMGAFPTDVLLTLEEGELDGYSVRRIRKQHSNDRGDIVLHPAPFVLRPGETKRIRWRVKTVEHGKFVPPVAFKYETVFPGENFEITVEGRKLSFPSGKPGEARVFDLKLANGRTCRARGYTSRPFANLVEDRIRFIVRNQQCNDPKSPLYGAFLPYSNVERLMYYDSRFSDHNACRERLGIGILLIDWLKDHPDSEVAAAVDRYENFVMREILDAETGVAYNEIGRNQNQKRLYNAPQMMAVVDALYRFRGNPKYLECLERMIRKHYANGGDRFYSNGCRFSFIIRTLEKAGRNVTELKASARRHVDNIIANGMNYPVHEVNFEQTIVAPGAEILIDWCLSFGDYPPASAQLPKHLDVLTRFDGDQPSYLQGGTPIRHWDGYWFGGNILYGDTLHYLSACSARVYWHFYQLSGDESYRRRSERCFRNLLCLFNADGTASSCYFLPLSVTYLNEDGTQRDPARFGECFDPWSNDQDSALRIAYECGVFKR